MSIKEGSTELKTQESRRGRVQAVCLRKKEMAWLARIFRDLVAVEDA